MVAQIKAFGAWQFPVAAAMARLLEQGVRGDIEPLAEYLCYWVSLKSICATIAAERGCVSTLETVEGLLQVQELEGLSMPRVRIPTEYEQLEAACAVFTAPLKEELILHRCTRYFANRLPSLRGEELTVDVRGQKLNGVLDLWRTVEARNPVWSPIDHDLYYAYLNGERSNAAADTLARQILGLVYTVGSNRFNSEARFDYVSSASVIERALPLLRTIVNWFVHAPERG